MTGEADGRRLVLGTATCCAARAVAAAGARETLAAGGGSAVALAVDGGLAGFIAVADPMKATTPAAIAALHAAGVRIVMADRRLAARPPRPWRRELGIDEVDAEVLPEAKGELVKRLRGEGRVVAMAGDGVNDAPALARADVGIAMGTGTDVAMESAGVTLVKGDLGGIVRARAPLPRDDAQHPPEPRSGPSPTTCSACRSPPACSTLSSACCCRRCSPAPR